MRTSLLTIVGGFAALSWAQGSGTLPSCGVNTVITGLSQSGCGFTDANCVCKAKSIIIAVRDKIPKACKSEADRQVFLGFINGQCVGQPGYPIVQTVTSEAAGSPRLGAWMTGLAGAVMWAVGSL